MIRSLLIAGEKQTRDIVKVGLDQTGAFEVDLADDAWAVEMVKAKAYQVVISDATLADGSDGLDLLRQIREILPDSELLLIAHNKGNARFLSRDKQELGIYAFIHFPIEMIEFFRTVGRLLERIPGGSSAAGA